MHFNWSWQEQNNFGYFQTAVNLLAVYLYPDSNFSIRNPNNGSGRQFFPYRAFALQTGFTPNQILNGISDPNSPASQTVLMNITQPLYSHYSTVEGNICNGMIGNQCTWGNLTYNQWLTGSPLYNPLPGMDINPANSSYTIVYFGFTKLDYPVEAWYYG
jgi:hypothetical protein